MEHVCRHAIILLLFGWAVLVANNYIGLLKPIKAETIEPAPTYAEEPNITVAPTIDTADTIVGALKKVNELTIFVDGHEYIAKTPFWVRPSEYNTESPAFRVFEATRKEDGKPVRVYAFGSPRMVIEEDVQK